MYKSFGLNFVNISCQKYPLCGQYAAAHDDFTIKVPAFTGTEIKSAVNCNNGTMAKLRQQYFISTGFPKSKSNSAMIGRIRREDRPAVVPLADLVIEGRYSNTTDGGNFLIHDNRDRNRRVIVFASDDGLQKLGASNRW